MLSWCLRVPIIQSQHTDVGGLNDVARVKTNEVSEWWVRSSSSFAPDRRRATRWEMCFGASLSASPAHRSDVNHNKHHYLITYHSQDYFSTNSITIWRVYLFPLLSLSSQRAAWSRHSHLLQKRTWPRLLWIVPHQRPLWISLMTSRSVLLWPAKVSRKIFSRRKFTQISMYKIWFLQPPFYSLFFSRRPIQ